MKRQFGWALASVVSVSVGGLGAASAADLPMKAPPAPIAVVYNWTGCYVGVNGGWKGGRFHDTAATPAGTATIPGLAPTPFAADFVDLGHLNADSGAVGGQVGCRWENPSHWVFGVEGDLDWTDLHGTITGRTFGTGGSVFIPGDYYDNRSRWEGSLRGIVGRSFDKWLLYVTGGLAAADVSMTGHFIPTVVGGIPFPGSTGSDDKTLFGFTVGVGAAYAFAPNWDIGAEYRYSKYSGDDFGLGQVAAVCGSPPGIAVTVSCFNTNVTGHKDLETNEVLIKLNYRFNSGPVVARY